MLDVKGRIQLEDLRLSSGMQLCINWRISTDVSEEHSFNFHTRILCRSKIFCCFMFMHYLINLLAACLMLFFNLILSLVLMMEEASSSWNGDSLSRTARRYIAEDRSLRGRCCDNKILHFFISLWGWSGTESTITEATYWSIVPAQDDR
jgi:hypothetical protein